MRSALRVIGGIGSMLGGAAVAALALPRAPNDPAPPIAASTAAPRRAPPAPPPMSASSLTDAAATDRARALIRGSYFFVHRKVERYEALLGPGFADAIARLGPADHFLDAGAGEGIALAGYRSGCGDACAATTGVSFTTTPGARRKAAAGGVRLLVGRPFEDLDLQELQGDKGPFAVITDVFGVLSYAANPGLVLNRYVEALRPGGELHVHLGNGAGNTVERSDGTTSSLLSWIAAHGGSAVELRTLGFVLRRGARPPTFPPLQLERIETEGRPPFARVYREGASRAA